MRDDEIFMHVKELGDLYLYDVLLEYIYPRVFVCEDIYDSKYLFYELDNEDDKDTWIVTKVTKKEYYSLVDGKKAIQKAYKNKNNYDLFTISKSYGKEEDIIRLDYDVNEWIKKLPKEDVFAEKTIPDDLVRETLEAARETGTTTFDIRLYAGTDRHFVPQNILTEICKAMTPLTNSVFGQKRSETLSVATAPGSCVIRFSFPDQINLFNETDADNELKVINSVLSSESILEGLEKVKEQEKFLKAYTRILDSIKKTNSAVQFTTASPNSTEVKKVELSRAVIKSRYQYVKEFYDTKKETFVFNGTLIALDIKAKKFKLMLEDGSIKSGVVAKELCDKGTFELPKEYKAVIDIEKLYNKDESRFMEKYCLKSLAD